MSQTIKMWLYPGANPNSTPTSWGPYETDITAYVRRPGQDGGAAITYQWGKQDESTQTDPGQMTCTLDNRDGRFSTDKIDGPYYGKIDTNTPIRLGVLDTVDTFTRTVTGALGPAAGWGGSWLNSSAGAGSTTYSVDGSKGLINLSAANIATTAILGNAQARDVDMVSTIVPIATAGGASYGMGHVARYTDTSNNCYSTIEFNTGGNVTIKIRSTYQGSNLELASANPISGSTYSAGVPWVLRTQMDGDTMRVKAWPASGTEPSAWMISADDGNNSGTGIGIYAVRFASNTNTGNFIAMDSMTVTALEWTGYVVSWPLRWDQTGNNSWVPITAGGILRRLRQGTNPIQSPLRRSLGNTADVTGYWPLEEGASAKYFLPVSKNTATATFADVTPGADSSLAGGSVAPTLNNATSLITAQTKIANNGTGMAAAVLFKLPSIPSTKTRIIRVRANRGPVPIWDFSVDATGTYIEAVAADGTIVTTVTNTYGTSFADTWIAWQLETDNSGGSTAFSSLYHAVGTNAPFFSQTGTVTGTNVTNVTQMELTGVQGAAFAHIWMGKNTFPFVTSAFANVSAGWDGETAATRFARVCGEAGVAYSVAGPNSLFTSTEKMGPQKEGSTMAVLQACADADYGVVTERGAGLEFVPRASRWNLAQSMALAVSAGQIAAIPEPVRDDQRLRNKWTISRNNGSSSSFQSDTSVAINGTWEDSASLNVFDDSVLTNHAAWRVNVGSQLRLRWPSISIDLARNPSLVPYWRTRFYGWRLGVTTGVGQVTGNEPDLIMEGYTATLTPETWTVEMNATDAKVWAAAVTDDTGIYGRADNEYCTTTALISSTALTVPITTGLVQGLNMPKWDTTSGLWSGGVDFNVGGERVTVTSIANAGGASQTVIDNFSTSTVDTTKWTVTGTLTAGGTNLTIPATTGYPGILSKAYTIDLTTVKMGFQLTSTGSADSNTQFYFAAIDSAGNAISMEADPTSATWTIGVDGAATVSGLTKVISTFWSTWTANDYLAATMVGSTFYLYKSTGGTTWTEIGHCTVGGTFNKNAVGFQINSGEATGTTTWKAVIDNVSTFTAGSGGAQDQTLNLSARGLNGYAASHASGTSVSLWNPAVVAL